ncbi:MAG: hypothetical protein II372_03555, partial [Clostridia bacterium]|nr:hypothetical protein [Clostridia bacterium]
MIRLINALPNASERNLELTRIKCTYKAYSNDALFWIQDDFRVLACMLDGNMTIYNRNADLVELKEFITLIGPASVFSDIDTLMALFGNGFEEVQV